LAEPLGPGDEFPMKKWLSTVNQQQAAIPLVEWKYFHWYIQPAFEARCREE